MKKNIKKTKKAKAKTAAVVKNKTNAKVRTKTKTKIKTTTTKNTPKKVAKKVVKKVTKKIAKKVTTKIASKIVKKDTDNVFDREKLQAILKSAIKLSCADYMEIYCSIEDRQATRFSDNAISQNLLQKNVKIVISSHKGRRVGKVEINSFDKEVIKNAVKQSEEIVDILPEDPEYVLPVSKDEAKKYLKSIIAKKDVNDCLAFDEIAKKIQEGIKSCKKVSAKFAGSYKHSRYQDAFMNSNGVFAHGYYSAIDWMNIIVMPAGESSYAHGTASNVNDLDFKKVTKEALEKAIMAQNPIDIEPGKYSVILSPEAIDEILLYAFWGGFDAKNCDEGLVYLRGKLGEKVFASSLNISSDPNHKAVPTLVFNTNGCAFKKRDWIIEGNIENLCYSRFWAQKNNKEATLYPPNLIMQGNDKLSLDKIIKDTKDGILVTRLWYIRFVDPMIPSITGMTRDGTFLIKDGKIVSAIKNMRFNDSIIRILNNIEVIGKPEATGEFMRNFIPAIRVKDFNFTSKTTF